MSLSVKKWLGRQTNLNDLASLDEELYQGLIKLKQYDGNVEDLALTFTLDVDGACLELTSSLLHFTDGLDRLTDFGVTETVDLVLNGAKYVP